MKNINFPLLCGSCNTDIEKEDHAMVEWIENDAGDVSDVKIVHNAGHSPRKNCYQNYGNHHFKDLHFDQVMNNESFKHKLGF